MLISIVVPLYCVGFLLVSIIQEADGADFNDLGKLLLGGFILAVCVAVAFTFVKLRLRDKKPAPAAFISINSFPRKE